MKQIISVSLALVLFGVTVIAQVGTARAQIYVNNPTSVREYTTSGVFVRNVVSSGLVSAQNLTFGPDGMLYVADDGAGAVKKFDPNTGQSLGSVITGLNRATSAKFGSDGNLYVSEYNKNRVLQVNPITGGILQAYTGVNAALGLQFMPGGDLLAAEGNSGGRIRRINTTTGSVTTFLTSTNIADVHLLPGGDYVFSDRSGKQLHRTTSAGGSFTNFTSGSVPSFPYFMDNTATTLYLGSVTNGVYEYNLTTGAFLGSFGPSGATGVAVRPSIATVPESSALILLALPILSIVTFRRKSK